MGAGKGRNKRVQSIGANSRSADAQFSASSAGDEIESASTGSSVAPFTVTEEIVREMHDAACDGRRNGWRPYSKFAVAASARTKDGRVFGGCGNVECANYTLTKHGEETAIIAALADGAMQRSGRNFLQAVYIPLVGGNRAMSCGGCRQFMWEFSDESTVVIVETPGGGHEVHRLIDLIPEPFGPNDLGISAADNPLE